MRISFLLLVAASALACGSSSSGDLAAGSDGGEGGLPDGSEGGTDGGIASGDGGRRDPDASIDAALGALRAGDSTLTFTTAGQSRSVLLHVPSAISSGPLPLVVALHGNGDTNTNFVTTLGWKALADADKFILAAPQGITQSFTVNGQPVNGVDWDAYRTVAGGNIDLPMLDELRARLVATGSVDTRRTHVFGYSQGGFMSFRWGMEAAGALSCAAVCAASNPLGASSMLVARAARKIPVAMQIGTNDFGINAARATRDELTANGNPLQYNEINGAGHVPFPGDPKVPLDFCRGQVLP